jgi:S-(hydroxymethyl)glutathione dehydrogenase/alcohol dehydrogenase
VYAAGVRAGQTVVIFGAGGAGSNAVQGAKYAGAANVIVVDPVAGYQDLDDGKIIRGVITHAA